MRAVNQVEAQGNRCMCSRTDAWDTSTSRVPINWLMKKVRRIRDYVCCVCVQRLTGAPIVSHSPMREGRSYQYNNVKHIHYTLLHVPTLNLYGHCRRLAGSNIPVTRERNPYGNHYTTNKTCPCRLHIPIKNFNLAGVRSRQCVCLLPIDLPVNLSSRDQREIITTWSRSCLALCKKCRSKA